MKVHIIKNKITTEPKEIEVISKFIRYLQSQMRLKKDIKINLISSREGSMTTGVRKSNGINVLYSNRLLIDVLRTIAHEWVHEYQCQILKLNEKKKKIKDIGGTEENMANVMAGIFMKKFQKKYPQYNKRLYGE